MTILAHIAPPTSVLGPRCQPNLILQLRNCAIGSVQNAHWCQLCSAHGEMSAVQPFITVSNTSPFNWQMSKAAWDWTHPSVSKQSSQNLLGVLVDVIFWALPCFSSLVCPSAALAHWEWGSICWTQTFICLCFFLNSPRVCSLDLSMTTVSGTPSLLAKIESALWALELVFKPWVLAHPQLVPNTWLCSFCLLDDVSALRVSVNIVQPNLLCCDILSFVWWCWSNLESMFDPTSCWAVVFSTILLANFRPIFHWFDNVAASIFLFCLPEVVLDTLWSPEIKAVLVIAPVQKIIHTHTHTPWQLHKQKMKLFNKHSIVKSGFGSAVHKQQKLCSTWALLLLLFWRFISHPSFFLLFEHDS